MKFLQSKIPWLLSILSCQSVCGLTLLETLASYPELSTLNGRITASPVLVSLLGAADGLTFFAPTNAAFDRFLIDQPNSTQDAFEALAQYSLIRGAFPGSSFKTEPQFIHSNLVDARFSNITGGQVVELVKNENNLQVISGNRSVSTVTTSDISCVGGIVHIVDQVLQLPAPIITAVTSAQFGSFLSILSSGGYLNGTKSQYVGDIFDSTDVTYFVPNSQLAASNFAELAKSFSDEDLRKIFQYHVVPKYLGYSNSLKNGTLTTAEGSNLTITILGKDIYVNAAKIITADYLVSNGVIHGIDGLLDRFNIPASLVPSLENATLALDNTTVTQISTSTSSLTTLSSSISISTGTSISAPDSTTPSSSISVASDTSKSASSLTKTSSSVSISTSTPESAPTLTIPTSSVSAIASTPVSAPEATVTTPLIMIATDIPMPTPKHTVPASLSSTATPSPLSAELKSAQFKDMTLKVGIGAGLGSAAIISLLGFFLFLRRKSQRNSPKSVRNLWVWEWDDGRTSRAPSNPQRYFVNNGNLEMQQTQSATYIVPVTNLESGMDLSRKRFSERPLVPLKSPSRLNGGGHFF